MKKQGPLIAPGSVSAGSSGDQRRWLLLVQQLPSSPSNLRVRVWRRLQQLGAIALKQAVYALPDSPEAREDFEWLKTEIAGGGGDAMVFAADSVGGWSDDALVVAFNDSRAQAYRQLVRDIKKDRGTGRRSRRISAERQRLAAIRARFHAIESVDFFGSGGRESVASLLEQLEADLLDPGQDKPSKRQPVKARGYKGRLWVTRPRPGVDRMASAWLIKRFIDAKARFDFSADRQAVPADGVPFDMFGVTFSHEGAHCTFETLCTVFAVHDPAVSRLAMIVHDLDFKDDRFAAQDAPTVDAVITGLRAAYSDDHQLLDRGMSLFEALYRAFAHSARRTESRRISRLRGGKGR